jgi:hypothetical protein
VVRAAAPNTEPSGQQLKPRMAYASKPDTVQPTPNIAALGDSIDQPVIDTCEYAAQRAHASHSLISLRWDSRPEGTQSKQVSNQRQPDTHEDEINPTTPEQHNSSLHTPTTSLHIEAVPKSNGHHVLAHQGGIRIQPPSCMVLGPCPVGALLCQEREGVPSEALPQAPRQLDLPSCYVPRKRVHAESHQDDTVWPAGRRHCTPGL